MRQISALAVNLPAIRFSGDQRTDRRTLGVVARHARPIDLAIEAEPDRLEIERRGGVLGARGEGDIGAVEAAVEIFDPRAPMRREAVFDAGTGDPAGPRVQDFRDVTCGRRVEIALAHPCKAAGGIDQPRTTGVAEAAAQARGVVPLLRDGVGGCRQEGDDRVGRDVVGKRKIAFGAHQPAGVEPVIVAGLHATDHAAEDAAVVDPCAVVQRKTRRAQAIAGVCTDIQARPVVDRLQRRRLQRQVGRVAGGGKSQYARGNRRGRPQVQLSVTPQRQNARPQTRMCPTRRDIPADSRRPCHQVLGAPAIGRDDLDPAQFLPKPLSSLQTLLQLIRNSN
ncbi:hypothetical protein ACVW0I_008250 [Bradyrhizobium sp. LM6.11]